MYQSNKDRYQDIFAAEVERWRARGARIIDVREPWEYAQGRLPGAELIPTGEIEGHLDELRGPLVIVCASGNRSSMVAQYLAANGVTEVANLMGGTAGWARDGRPIER